MIRRGGTGRWQGLLAVVLLLMAGRLLVAEAQGLPPRPDRYVTDQASLLDAGTVATVNAELEQFEKETSNQILVAIYPDLPPDQDVAQYAADTLDSWGVGQKGKDNGAILFVFVHDHKIFIVTGRGLEGALPDAMCKNIVTEVISPAFKQGDYAGGIQAGVNAMIAASKGEYKGNGSTVREGKDHQADNNGRLIIFVLILLFIIGRAFFFPNARSGPMIYTGGGWGGGGYGGGYGGGGGGGFSGGGGSSAGGGAGGSW